jgi:methionine--tRNA ligase beta chain
MQSNCVYYFDSVLEDCAREVLDGQAPRMFAIADPLKVTLTNWASPESAPEVFTTEQHPKRPELGSRELPFTGSLYIDREDFFDTGVDGTVAPPRGYKRLLPGGQVRLKYAYVITCEEVVRDAQGSAVELRCSYDAATRAGATPEGQKKVRGIVQWVSRSHAVPADLYQYDRLFMQPSPGKEHEGDFLQDLNPHSLSVLKGAVVEPSVLHAQPGETFQFERVGYFCLDARNNLPPLSRDGPALKFNRVVTLKDTWGAEKDGNVEKAQKVQPAKKQGEQAPPVEDIRRVEMRVGRVVSVEKHPDADGLYVEQVDCGEASPRTIISGLVRYMTAEELMGRRVVVLCNLKPSKMRGIVSEGMLLAASVPKQGGEEGEEEVELLEPPTDAPVGELISVSGFDAPCPDEVLKSKSAMEVWKRVAAELVTNDCKQASFGATGLLVTSAGPCTVPSLVKAAIR